MVEVGTVGHENKLKRKVETRLENIIKDYSFEEGDNIIYRGHPAIYSARVAETMELVQRSGGLSRGQLLKRKPHWHPDFEVRVCQSLEEHNYTFASKVVQFLAKHTSEGKPVIWVTPVGPMGHYGVIAEMMNRLGASLKLRTDLIFPFAMDEWSDENGNMVANRSPFARYMTSFAQDMYEQFYSKLDNGTKIPESNLRSAANVELRDYLPAMKKLLAQDAGVLFTGGVGMVGHIMFWESTYGTLLGKELSEKVIYIRGAPLTSETMAQNRFTSTASAPVPAYANTIGLGLFCTLREYERENPGRVNAILGLDNVEEPLIFQRFIAQSMLAMRDTDPSFGATYPATVPGLCIIVENLLKGFKVPAAH